MASLTGQLVAETYKALLKTIDNDILTASEKQITDGFGGGSNVFIDSQGFLRANKYKVTNGLATQFLKADGSLDANTYLTGITSSQIITALGYTPVTNARTLTINGTTYDLSANRSWTIAGTAAVWGNISGTLSNQTDLQNALNAKFNNPTGTISQYIRGDGSLATLPSAAVWGNITGTLSAQTDLQAALDAKFDDPTGNSTQYIDGSGNLQTFPTMLSSDNLIKLVRNQSGATMTAGTIVYINGATGNKPTIAKALATSDATSAQTYGMVQADISNNADGYIVVIGNVNNLNTHSLTEGAQLYLSATTAGAWTTTKQYAPNHLVYVGIVLRSHPNQGIIGVKIQNGYEMDELHNVSAQTPSNNDGLFYETSTSLWKNKSITDALGFVPQRLDKMVSNLLASSTEYPNSNAVIAALALKANAENPVFTGNMTISGAEPKLYFTDTDQNPDYFIGADAGFFRIYDQTAGATRFVINSSGVTTIAGDLIVGTIAKSGGTATQFLKADGSIDSSTYVTSASLANYLLISTAASTYQRLDKMVSNLLASDTEYPNSNAVLAKLALKADAANPVFTGDMTISGISPKLYFTDTDNNPDYTLFVDSGYFYIYDQTAGATKFQITPSGNAINTGTLTSASFIKSGGTSSQYLMADGSVSTLSGLITGSGGTNYLPKWTSASALGNSLIYDHGDAISIATTSNVNAVRLQVAASSGSWISGTFGGTGNGDKVVIGNIAGPTIGGHNSALSAWSTLAINPDGGNVMIGSQTDLGYKLYVNGSVKTTSILSTSFTDGYVTWDAAQFNRTGGFVEFQWAGSAGVRYFGNTAYPITFAGLTGAANFSSSITAGADITMSGGNRSLISSGGFLQMTSTSGAIYLSPNSSTIMTLTTTGSVGIGTTSPVSSTGHTGLSISGSSISRLDFMVADVRKGLIYSYDSGFSITSQGANPLILGTNDTERMRIASGGNVLIGTTTDSGYKLDVNGTGRFTDKVSIAYYTSGTPLRIDSINGNNVISNTKLAIGTGGQYGTITNKKFLDIDFNGYNNYTQARIRSWDENGSTGYGSLYFYTNGTGGTDATTLALQLNYNGNATLYNNLTVNSSTNIPYRFAVLGSQAALYGTTYYQSVFIQDTTNYRGVGFGFDTSGQVGVIYSESGGSASSLAFATYSGSAWGERMRITSGGDIQFKGASTGTNQQANITNDDTYFTFYPSNSGSVPKATRFMYNGASAEAMRITSGGNVLIGTTTDNGSKLQVRSSTAQTDSVGYLQLEYTTASSGNAGLTVKNTYGTSQFMQWESNGLRFGSRILTSTGSGNLYLTAGADSVALTILASGASTFSSSVTATSFFESSDFRLKTLINNNPIIHGIEHLKAKLYEKNGKIELGYFAQDAEMFMPYAVTKNADGFLNLSYREIHTAKIARLEKEVAKLKAKLNAA